MAVHTASILRKSCLFLSFGTSTEKLEMAKDRMLLDKKMGEGNDSDGQ
jgi:hypothetical protein